MTTKPNLLTLFAERAELAVLGAILADGRLYADASAFLTAHDFWGISNQYVFTAMATLANRGEVIDMTTVGAALESAGQLAEIGGDYRLAQLIGSVTVSENIERHARLIAERAARRRLLEAADALAQSAFDTKRPLDDVLAAHDTRLSSVRGNSEDDVRLIKDSVQAYFDRVEASAHTESAVGTPTGLRDWDSILGNLQAGSLNFIAARPAMGKTSLALCIALNVARLNIGGVYFWSGEMPDEQILERLFAIESGIPGGKLRNGLRTNGISTSNGEWMRFVNAAGELGMSPMYLDYATGITPSRLTHKATRVHRRHPLALIVVDYIGLMEAGVKTENKDKELGFISRRLKALAKIAPVVCCAQLSRAVENRANKRPMLSDLRDSGNLEQDADTVTFIYRDAVYNENTEFPNRAELIVAKNRHGGTGTAAVHFDRPITKFSNAATSTIDLSELT